MIPAILAGESPVLVALVGSAAIMLTVLGFNLFGDALRDALDPTASDR